MSSIKETAEKIFKTEKGIKNFWIMSTLTFGLTLDTLSDYLGISAEEVWSEYIDKSNFASSVSRKFHYIYVTQIEARANFEDFFRRLCEAARSKDVELYRKVLSEITDSAAISLMHERKSGAKLSDEQILTMLHYQLKYAISNTRLAEMFNINRNVYASRVKRIFVLYPQYESQYHNLTSDYLQNAYQFTRQKRGKK